MFKNFRKLWIALGVFVILSPLGLIATGTAFGEWGMDQLKEEIGFVPAGLSKFADLWQHVLLPDYAVPASGNRYRRFGYRLHIISRYWSCTYSIGICVFLQNRQRLITGDGSLFVRRPGGEA